MLSEVNSCICKKEAFLLLPVSLRTSLFLKRWFHCRDVKSAFGVEEMQLMLFRFFFTFDMDLSFICMSQPILYAFRCYPATDQSLHFFYKDLLGFWKNRTLIAKNNVWFRWEKFDNMKQYLYSAVNFCFNKGLCRSRGYKNIRDQSWRSKKKCRLGLIRHWCTWSRLILQISFTSNFDLWYF